MLNKTWLCIFVIILSAIMICGCANKSADTDIKSAQETTLGGSDLSTDVSIPTDSGLADNVFENVSRAPTMTDNEALANQQKNDAQATDGTEPAQEATAPNVKPEEMTYEAFVALSPAEQRLYQESFTDLEAFFEWYNAAKEKYEKENPPIDIDGPIDLDKV